MSTQLTIQRVIVYVDGFNLYFGMMDSGLSNCKWLDIVKLAESLLKHNQKLIETKYFTSRITHNPAKEKRQRTYIDAITEKGAKIVQGKYERKDVECPACNHVWSRSNEKMTDVNIATSIILDAIDDKFDVAILISGDSDLVPSINIVHSRFPPKSVTVCFPPSRSNSSVANAANGSMSLGRKKLVDAKMETEVTTKDGYVLKCPVEWIG